MADGTLRLLLVMGDSTGGIGRHVAALATRLAERGVEPTVVGPGRAVQRLVMGAGVRTVPAAVGSPGAGWSVARVLRRLAREADVVHAHGLRAGAACVLARLQRPLAVTWHNAPVTGGLRAGMHALMEGRVARGSDLTWAVSADLVERAHRAGAAAARPIFVPAPLSPPQVDPDRVRERLAVGDRPLVAAVGRLERQKRFDVLVDAAAGWSATEGPCVVVAGTGDLRASLLDRITRTGAPVRLLGGREDVPDLLAAATLAVVSSDWEGCPLVVQEALRAGTPLVATAVGGIPAMVGTAAALVPAGQPAALRETMDRLLTDPAERRRLAEAGPGQAASWPTMEEVVTEVHRTYLNLA